MRGRGGGQRSPVSDEKNDAGKRSVRGMVRGRTEGLNARDVGRLMTKLREGLNAGFALVDSVPWHVSLHQIPWLPGAPLIHRPFSRLCGRCALLVPNNAVC